MSKQRDRTRRADDPPAGVAFEPLELPGTDRLRYLDAQASDLRQLQQAAQEVRAQLVASQEREKALLERAQRAESLLAHVKEELDRVGADAMLARSEEQLLARRNAEVHFSMSSDMRLRVAGACRGSGWVIAGSMAELADKLLKNRG